MKTLLIIYLTGVILTDIIMRIGQRETGKKYHPFTIFKVSLLWPIYWFDLR